jgi:hypothetical protein
MTSDYLSKYVLVAYYAQEQDAGTKEEREKFSEDIFARFDHHIVAAAEQAGVELSVESRSIMAVLATRAPGASPKSRAGQAVRAYLEYRGL